MGVFSKNFWGVVGGAVGGIYIICRFELQSIFIRRILCCHRPVNMNNLFDAVHGLQVLAVSSRFGRFPRLSVAVAGLQVVTVSSKAFQLLSAVRCQRPVNADRFKPKDIKSRLPHCCRRPVIRDRFELLNPTQYAVPGCRRPSNPDRFEHLVYSSYFGVCCQRPTNLAVSSCGEFFRDNI